MYSNPKLHWLTCKSHMDAEITRLQTTYTLAERHVLHHVNGIGSVLPDANLGLCLVCAAIFWVNWNPIFGEHITLIILVRVTESCGNVDLML